MSAQPLPAPTGPIPAHDGVIHVDVTGLDDITPGVTVLAPRAALSAVERHITLTEPPTLRRVADIAGLQDLIDIAFTGSRANPPTDVTASLTDPALVPLVSVRAELTIHADDLRPGDVIDYSGILHHVTRVDRCIGLSWPVAHDGTGWAMALGHNLIVLHRT